MDDEWNTLARLAIAQDGLFLGIAVGFFAIRTWFTFRKHSRALDEVRRTPVTDIADLPALLRDSEEAGKCISAEGAQGLPVASGETPALLRAKGKVIVDEVKPTGNEESEGSSFVGRARRRGSGIAPHGLSVSPRQFTSDHAPGSSTSSRLPQGGPRSWFGEKFSNRQWESQSQSHVQQLVLVRGKVQIRDPDWPGSKRSVEPLRSEHAVEGVVAMEKSQTWIYAELKGMLGWIAHKEQIYVSKTAIPFVLEDVKQHFGSATPFVWISLFDAKQPFPMTKVYSHMNATERSWNATALHYIVGRRLPVGLLEEEKVLKLGTSLTAVGHVEKSSSGMPVIKAAKHMPCFLTGLTREELIAFLAQQSQWLFWGSVAITTVAVGLLGYSSFKNWRRWKAEILRRRRGGLGGSDPNSSARVRNAAALVDDDGESSGPIGDGELCVVCLTRRRRAVFVHCGHRVCCCACARCIQEGPTPRCPICRENVASVYRVFDA